MDRLGPGVISHQARRKAAKEKLALEKAGCWVASVWRRGRGDRREIVQRRSLVTEEA